MKKGFSAIFILLLVVLLSIGGFVLFKSYRQQPLQLGTLQLGNPYKPSTSPATSNMLDKTDLKIEGKIIGDEIKTGADFAAFKISTNNGIYTIKVPARKLSGIICDQDSPWPKENDQVKAFGKITGANEITCQSSGHYFKYNLDETANWKTYTNKELNFEFKRPPNWLEPQSEYGAPSFPFTFGYTVGNNPIDAKDINQNLRTNPPILIY